jgi:methanogenic corrinoid protein MtbC1
MYFYWNSKCLKLITMEDLISNQLYNEFYRSLIKGEKQNCSKVVNDLLKQNLHYEIIYEDLLKRALYDVGLDWEHNKISVATEHMASAIVDSILTEIYLHHGIRKASKKKVILACVEHEYHHLGLKMINDVFENNDWNTFLLGSNTPVNDIISYGKDVMPDLFAFSSSLYFNIPSLKKMITAVRTSFPKTPILVGGQALINGAEIITDNFENVFYKSNIKEVKEFINNNKI